MIDEEPQFDEDIDPREVYPAIDDVMSDDDADDPLLDSHQ